MSPWRRKRRCTAICLQQQCETREMAPPGRTIADRIPVPILVGADEVIE
jgi:hypothetical protein